MSQSEDLMAALRRVRKVHKIDQHSLAEMTGYHRTCLSHYETGKRKPSLQCACDLAEALGHELVLLPKKGP